MAYSADFRNKVVQLYNSGTSTADLCAQFHISRSILYQWSEEAKVSNISKRDLATLQRHVATLENENSIYQKSLAALDLSIDNKVQIIDALKSEYSFYTLCRLLNLSKSTYINRQKSALIEKQLDVEDTLLKEKITIIFQKSDYRFGAKKIRAKLMEQGYTVSTKRIVRLMKEHGLKRKQALPENATFQRHYTYRPNLVKQNFTVEKPNSIWVSDITYVTMCSGFSVTSASPPFNVVRPCPPCYNQGRKGGDFVADTQAMRQAIKHFKFYATPSSGSSSEPATVGDINKLIQQTAKLMEAFVDALEKDQ